MKILKTKFNYDGTVEVSIKEKNEFAIMHFNTEADYLSWKKINDYVFTSRVILWSLTFAVALCFIAWGLAILGFYKILEF